MAGVTANPTPTRRRSAAVLGIVAIIWLLAGVGATVVPGPSPEAEMVCSAEAESDITGVLGVTLVSRPAATWAAPVYTCTYALAVGPMVLSVRELSGEPRPVLYTRRAGANERCRGRPRRGCFSIDRHNRRAQDFKVRL